MGVGFECILFKLLERLSIRSQSCHFKRPTAFGAMANARELSSTGISLLPVSCEAKAMYFYFRCRKEWKILAVKEKTDNNE